MERTNMIITPSLRPYVARACPRAILRRGQLDGGGAAIAERGLMASSTGWRRRHLL